MRHWIVASLLASVSALLYALSFPPTRWTLASWVALVPLLLALRRGGLGTALFASWLWCVVGACVAGDWFPRAVAEYFGQSMLVALALFVGVFTFMAAPYLMVFAWAYRALARRYEAALPLLAAAAWAAAELGRGRLFTGTPFFIGNPWGIAGYAQVDNLALVQIASITGVYGVGFVIAYVNAAIAELLIAWRSGAGVRRSLVGCAVSIFLALGCLAYGAWALREAPADAPAVRVALVQGNLDVGSRWSADLYGRNLETYLLLTRDVVQSGRPTVAFWPEAAMTFFLEREPLYQRSIASLLEPLDLELVAGGPRVARENPALYTNSIYVISRNGSPAFRYDKEYLVPFSEYFPLRIDVLRRRFGRIREFLHGDQVAPLPTRAGLAGVLVCNEAMLPEVAARRVADGATYLVNPSNDSWIRDAKYVEQQLDIARLRAIEQRRYLVRASTAGPSAVVDPWGRVVASIPAGERGAVVGEVRARTIRTVYSRVGDLFAVVCAVAVVVALAVRRPMGPCGDQSGSPQEGLSVPTGTRPATR